MQQYDRTSASSRFVKTLLTVASLFAIFQYMDLKFGESSSLVIRRVDTEPPMTSSVNAEPPMTSSVNTDPPAVTSASNSSLQLPIRNIRLLGQFNYNTDASIVVEWVRIWSKYFEKISVVGPFDATNIRSLLQAKVDVHEGHNDGGRWSPVASLSGALQREAAREKAGRADAVLYAHDDALINLTYLAQGQQSVRTDRIAGTLYSKLIHEYSLVIPSDGSPIVYRYKNMETTNQTVFLRKLPYWFHHNKCIQQRLQMLNSSRTSADASVGLNRYGSLISFNRSTSSASIPARLFFFPAFTQSDMLLFPTRYTQEFVELATSHVQHQHFLECAFPTITLWLLHQEKRSRAAVAADRDDGASFGLHDSSLLSKEVTYLPLCTTFDDTLRGGVKMIEWCNQRGKDYYDVATASNFAMVHPFKIQRHGIEAYQARLARMQNPHFVADNNTAI